MARILCIGHSHITALHLGQWADEREADERNVWSFVRLPFRNLPSFVALTGSVERADVHIRDLIWSLLDTVEFDVLAISFGGNVHSAISLARPPRPYDFHLPGWPHLPADPDVELVPYAIVRKHLAARYSPYRQLIVGVTKLTSKPILHITQPPPNKDSKHIEKNPGGFKSLIEKNGISTSNLRMKYWILQQDIIGEICNALGIRVVPLAVGTTDDSGYLHPSCRGGDPTHGNRRFGALMLNALDGSLAALIEAGAAARASTDEVAADLSSGDASLPDGAADGGPNRDSIPDPLVVLAPRFLRSLYDAVEGKSITQTRLRLRLIERTQVPTKQDEDGADMREEVTRILERRPSGPFLSLVGVQPITQCLYSMTTEDLSGPDLSGAEVCDSNEVGRRIDRFLNARIDPAFAFLGALRRQASERVIVQLSPPPPVPDAFFRASDDGAPTAERTNEPLPPPAVRLDVWRRAVAIMAGRCADLDIGFVAVPPEFMDSDGFLARAHWGRDVMDTGIDYARQMLDRVDDHLGVGRG